MLRESIGLRPTLQEGSARKESRAVRKFIAQLAALMAKHVDSASLRRSLFGAHSNAEILRFPQTPTNDFYGWCMTSRLKIPLPEMQKTYARFNYELPSISSRLPAVESQVAFVTLD